MKRKSNIDDLRWQRIFDPIHIPTYLVEQIPDKDFTVENFYKYLSRNLLIGPQQNFEINPLFHVALLFDKNNIVKGFVWFTIDELSQNIFIQIYSVDCNYWGKGAVPKLEKYILAIKKGGDLKKVFWITRQIKHSQKFGFKPSKYVLMENNEEEEKENGKNTNRKSGPDKSSQSGATKISKNSL